MTGPGGTCGDKMVRFIHPLRPAYVSAHTVLLFFLYFAFFFLTGFYKERVKRNSDAIFVAFVLPTCPLTGVIPKVAEKQRPFSFHYALCGAPHSQQGKKLPYSYRDSFLQQRREEKVPGREAYIPKESFR